MYINTTPQARGFKNVSCLNKGGCSCCNCYRHRHGEVLILRERHECTKYYVLCLTV